MDLKIIPIEELVKELESRAGVKKISVGIYAPYELRKKYVRRKSKDETRGQINADIVLILP